MTQKNTFKSEKVIKDFENFSLYGSIFMLVENDSFIDTSCNENISIVCTYYIFVTATLANISKKTTRFLLQACDAECSLSLVMR